MDEQLYDVAVIGAGVIGCAIARELAGCDLKVALVEARKDIGDATSKSSTAILHTGFDASPGTLESQLVRRGYELWCDYAERTGVAVERVGALLVAWDDEQLHSLPKLEEKARANGYFETSIVDVAQVYATVPDLGHGALGGLIVPGESVIDSWGAALALATEAVQRGAELHVDAALLAVTRLDAGWRLHTAAGDITTRWVVNAAGLGGDIVDQLFGFDRFHLNPRKGELLVFDKFARPKVPVIVLPVPSKLGKGVLISPTIYGNVMLGPTAEDMEDRTDTATTERGFEFLFEKGGLLMPSLLDEEVTTAYAGLRAAHDQIDYVIEADSELQYLVAGCIRSTGLTSSLGVAEYTLNMLRESGLVAQARTQLPGPPRVPYLGETATRPYQDDARIAADPAYGEIVCFCERVTKGEIRDAFQSPVPARDLPGLRRRTRVQNGRCQGFFCGAHVRSLIEQQLGGAQ